MRFLISKKGALLSRQPRIQSSTDVYHITIRGTGKMVIFEDDIDRRHFLQLLLNAKKKHAVLIFSYCLMSNHVHLVVRAGLNEISEMMRYVNGLYAEDFNERHGRNGHLFQERFHSVPIEEEAHLFEAIRYVICNPARAGICSPENYKWSSYREYMSGSFLTDCELLADEFPSPDHFKKFIENASDADMLFKLKHQKLDDSQAILAAKAILHLQELTELQMMGKSNRDRCIRALKDRGLSARQICRVTGLGRYIVNSA